MIVMILKTVVKMGDSLLRRGNIQGIMAKV